jgi:uncharacterized protein (TIGR03000 family)
VQFSIKVPSAARVFVNGHLTDSRGDERHYFASNLQLGYDYDFQIAVEMRRGGKLFSAARTVRVRAGQSHQLVFSLPDGHDSRPWDQIALNLVTSAASGD